MLWKYSPIALKILLGEDLVVSEGLKVKVKFTFTKTGQISKKRGYWFQKRGYIPKIGLIFKKGLRLGLNNLLISLPLRRTPQLVQMGACQAQGTMDPCIKVFLTRHSARPQQVHNVFMGPDMRHHLELRHQSFLFRRLEFLCVRVKSKPAWVQKPHSLWVCVSV